ncbi:MAG TPA: NADPH-dependent F420 reductase [Anaerolineales bacterium]|nr:NADPH-dependent F420 reductase [Anaerolineales bacterium]
MDKESLMLTIGVIGGTGKEGKGLAYRWAKAGYRVLIGSRFEEKAVTAASEIMQLLEGSSSVVGTTNLEAAEQSDIVVLTVPYAAHKTTLESVKHALRGKLLIDTTVPIMPPKVTKVQMPPAGSAAQEAKEILGEDVQITAAFQNISHKLLMGEEFIECDVLVTGTGKDARHEALKLVEAAGLTGWDAGPIENSVVVEGLANVLININKQYGSTHAGIKITGANQSSTAKDR